MLKRFCNISKNYTNQTLHVTNVNKRVFTLIFNLANDSMKWRINTHKCLELHMVSCKCHELHMELHMVSQKAKLLVNISILSI